MSSVKTISELMLSFGSMSNKKYRKYVTTPTPGI